jgi:hypothetical protein
MARSRSPILAFLVLLLAAGTVLASHVTPRVVDGATSCGPLTPGTVELLVDATDLPAGAVSDGDFSATVTLEGTIETGTVAFQDATLPVKSAFVAGATSGNLYEYEEPVTADDGLVAPDGQPIVNVSFCYVTDDTGGGAAEETAGGGTPPATDTAPAAGTATPASGSVALVALGVVALAAGMLLFARQRLAVRATRKNDDRQPPPLK